MSDTGLNRLLAAIAAAAALLSATPFLSAASPALPNNVPAPSSPPLYTPPAPATQPLQMIFPANPPALGLPMPQTEQLLPPVGDPARSLSGEMLELFFAPLSTYWIEPPYALNKKLAAQLTDYRLKRADLLAEIRRTITATRLLSADERRAAFVALATAQESRLVALEKSAEELRVALAREANWYELRTWQLGRGDLNQSRAQNAVFEYELVRAAAFYQDGLSPAQRHLLREMAWQMERAIFARGDSAAEPFQFFSPDMMLLRFPANLPAKIAEEIERHVRQKDALRTELRDALYDADKAMRFRRPGLLRRLADEQQPRIDALEDLAEMIRRDLAAWDTSWRRSPPSLLPAHIQVELDAYLALRAQMQVEYEQALAPVRSAPPPNRARGDARATRDWEEARQDRISQADDAFLRDHAAVIAELERRVLALDEKLTSLYAPSDAGVTARDTFRNFLHRRLQEQVYYEYDIAAYEPGLSPRQRAMLFAAAVADLQLPLPLPEHQATTVPQVVVK